MGAVDKELPGWLAGWLHWLGLLAGWLAGWLAKLVGWLASCLLFLKDFHDQALSSFEYGSCHSKAEN